MQDLVDAEGKSHMASILFIPICFVMSFSHS
jgi:hypothetical protein